MENIRHFLHALKTPPTNNESEASPSSDGQVPFTSLQVQAKMQHWDERLRHRKGWVIFVGEALLWVRIRVLIIVTILLHAALYYGSVLLDRFSLVSSASLLVGCFSLLNFFTRGALRIPDSPPTSVAGSPVRYEAILRQLAVVDASVSAFVEGLQGLRAQNRAHYTLYLILFCAGAFVVGSLFSGYGLLGFLGTCILWLPGILFYELHTKVLNHILERSPQLRQHLSQRSAPSASPQAPPPKASAPPHDEDSAYKQPYETPSLESTPAQATSSEFSADPDDLNVEELMQLIRRNGHTPENETNLTDFQFN